MSNKTTFKRIALAVVAVLGFGVLSAGPTSAAVSSLTVTPTNGTGATTLLSDSTTAAVMAISFVKTEANDSVVVTSFLKSAPTTAALAAVESDQLVQMVSDSAGATMVVTADSDTVTGHRLSFGTLQDADTSIVLTGGSATGVIAAKIRVFFNDTRTTLVAGTYTITTIVTPFNNGVIGTPTTVDATITVEAVASASKVVDSTKTIAILSNIQNPTATVNTPDSALSVAATAGTSAAAWISVQTFNASGVATSESVTVTISGAGVLGNSGGTTFGSSLTFDGHSGDTDVQVRANGVAGVGSIVVSTTSKTFAAKTITFYATDPATYAPSLDVPVIGVGSATDDVVSIVAKDSNGNVWGGTTLYLYSSDTAIAKDATCTFLAADQAHYCDVEGVKAGETKWTIGNKSTLALSTVKSAEFGGPRVSSATAATVKIEFDKAAYAPGEKARIYVTPLDAAGLTLPGSTSFVGLLATGGLTSNTAFSSGSDTLTAVDLPIASASSATTGAKAGSAMYTVYMPFGKGTVTLTAKGGTGLPVAGRVAVTASADVVDDSVDAAVDAAQEATDAAIAATDAAILAQEAADEAASAAIAAQETAQAAVDAVTALSAEVTKLVAQLATLQKLLNRVAKRVGVKQ